MLWLITLDASQIVSDMKRKVSDIKDYTATLESKTPKKDGKEEYKLYLQKYMRPGLVYMSVIEGENKGGVAVYDPKTNKVRAKKGFLKLTLSPDDSRLRSPVGHRIYESHIIYFVERINSAEFISEDVLQGKKVYVIKVPLDPDKNYGATYSQYWIDADKLLPIMIIDYTSDGKKVRTVKFKDIKVNVGLTSEDFNI